MKQISDQLGLVQLQLEFVELKSSDELQRQFRVTYVVDFWKLVEHLPNTWLANRMISMSPSTYRCEAAFYALSKIKCRNRNILSLQHTTEALRVAVSSAEPDFKSLVRQRECQKSHWVWSKYNITILTTPAVYNLLLYGLWWSVTMRSVICCYGQCWSVTMLSVVMGSDDQ